MVSSQTYDSQLSGAMLMVKKSVWYLYDGYIVQGLAMYIAM